MTFDILKVLHIGSMFMATALAVGPLVVMYLVARTRDAPAIARTFSFSTSIGRIGGAMYGLGIVFGVLAALNGSIWSSSWASTASSPSAGSVGSNGRRRHPRRPISSGLCAREAPSCRSRS